MSITELEKLEYIEGKLLKIREIIKLEDAYQVCDAIIISINDESLEEHIKNMLKMMGYENNIIKDICFIIKKMQNLK